MILTLPIAGPSTARVPLTLTVTFLDVGHGDSILVQVLNGLAMLVDAGESSAASAVSAGRAAEGIGRLEFVDAPAHAADRMFVW